jgi:purine-cytosine permease-like protein
VCGFDWICRLERWLTYVIIIPFIVLTLGFVAVIGPSHVFLMGTFNRVAYFSQLAAAAVYLVSYVIYVSDYTRYLPAATPPGRLLFGVFLGPFVSSVWLMALGTLFASTLKNGASLTSALTAGDMIVPGFGTAIMILAAVAQVVVMPLNTYGASLAALTAVDGFHSIRSSARSRVSATLALSALILLIAVALPHVDQGTFNDFLSFITYFMVPWSAINLVDYYWIRRRKYSVGDLSNNRGVYGRWSWRGLAAQAAGVVAMIPFIAIASFTGAGARALGGVDVSLLAGALVAGAVYYALCRSLDRNSEDRAYRAGSETPETTLHSALT